nr:heme A synthase [Corynebacterium sp. c6VSa_13]
MSRIPTIAVQRRLALVLLILQGGITVTGSIVRVTGSGLGCDTWPNCHAGSLVPVQGAAPLVHQFIEFGNRLLTFVLVASVVAVLYSLYKAQRRTELKVYGIINAVGIVVQAVIGGISVHLDLQWWAVALHFLPSIILVWISALLYQRVQEPDDGVVEQTFPQVVRICALSAALALAVVLVTGTMTTGAGPHAGDATAGMEGRLEVDIDIMAHVHGLLMYLYFALTAATVFLLYRFSAPQESRRTGLILMGLIVVQGAIGIAQYRLGVPRWTVPIHIGMSSVVTAFSAFLYAHGVIRTGGSATKTGSPAGDAEVPSRVA